LAGELLERAQHGLRGVVLRPGLDERQVDLHDLEADVAEEPETGVARSDVVGREAHPGAAARLDVLPELVEVLDLLALRQLQDHLVEGDSVAVEDRLQVADAEEVGLERSRREVDADVDALLELPDPARDDLEAEEVELDGPTGRLGRREHRAGVPERRGLGRADEALVADRSAGRHGEDRLIDGANGARHEDRLDAFCELGQGPGLGAVSVQPRVVGDDRGAAVPLAPVQGRVGVPVEEPRIGGRHRDGRDADRQREGLDRRARVATAQRRGEDPAGDREAGLEVRPGQQEGELVAADPEGTVGASQVRRDRARERHQQVVARDVAALVVDRLQVVHVDEHEDEAGVVPAHRLELARQLVLERAVVAETGEPVAERIDPGAVVELVQLGPLGLDRRRVAEDRPRQQCHERRERDRRGDQDQDGGQPVAIAGCGEHLDRRDAHQADEWQEEDDDQTRSDRIETTSLPPRRPGGVARKHWVGILVCPGAPFYAVDRVL
jgi:hypothetical protein